MVRWCEQIRGFLGRSEGEVFCTVTVFWWLALVRRQFTGVVCWWEQIHSVLVARFGEKTVYRSRVLVGEMSECYGGLLWLEGSIQESCAGGRTGILFWWLASARRQCVGVV